MPSKYLEVRHDGADIIFEAHINHPVRFIHAQISGHQSLFAVIGQDVLLTCSCRH